MKIDAIINNPKNIFLNVGDYKTAEEMVEDENVEAGIKKGLIKYRKVIDGFRQR